MSRCDCCDLPVESCGKAAEDRSSAAKLPGTAPRCSLSTPITLDRKALTWRAECCAP